MDLIQKYIKEQLLYDLELEKEVMQWREKFVNDFPRYKISLLTLNEFLIGFRNDTFCERIRYTRMASLGDSRPSICGIYYTKGTHELKLAPYYSKKYGEDYDAAFDEIKKEIINVLNAAELYDCQLIEKSPLNNTFKYLLIETYFPDKYLAAPTSPALNAYCDKIGIGYKENDEMIYRNLELIHWKESVSEIRYWSNWILMRFCDWLWKVEKISIKGSDYSQKGYYQRSHAEIRGMKINSYEPPSVKPPYIGSNVLGLATHESYDIVMKTLVTAHPAEGWVKDENLPYILPIKKGGFIEVIMEVDKKIECYPDNIEECKEWLDSEEYEQLLSYHILRKDSFGYGEKNTKYRFYIMHKYADILQPCKKTGIRRSVHLSLNTIPIDDKQPKKRTEKPILPDVDYRDYSEGSISMTKEDWKYLITDILSTDEIELLKIISENPPCVGTYKEIAKMLNCDSGSIMQRINNLSKKVQTTMNIPTMKKGNGQEFWWPVLFLGKLLENFNYEWKLRDEIVGAIIDIYGIEITDEREKNAAKKLSDEDLLKYAAKDSKKEPIYRKVKERYRSPYVAEMAKRRAKGFCDLCGEKAPFEDKNGNPYLEAHHIVWLSRDGDDSIDNVVALCPNCHKEMHVLDGTEDVIEKIQVLQDCIVDYMEDVKYKLS